MAGPEITALQVFLSSVLLSSFLIVFFFYTSHKVNFLKKKSSFLYLPQALLSSVSQLCHSFGSRVDWLEQEVSTLRSHVMALHSELQDDCQGDSGAFVPVSLISLAV